MIDVSFVTVDGPRLDSHLRTARFVFDQIDIGFRFVRSASRAGEGTSRATILTFAQRAYDSARWWIDIAPLTADERKRARLGLDTLFQEIERCQSGFDA